MCPRCRLPVPANEAACYQGCHEDCYVAWLPGDPERVTNRDKAMPGWVQGEAGYVKRGRRWRPLKLED